MKHPICRPVCGTACRLICRLAAGILLAAGLCFLSMAYREHRPFKEAKVRYEALALAVITADDPDHPLDRSIDFGALQKMNPDIVGWLYIPRIGADYPVMRGADNEEYLSLDFAGNESPLGAVFTWAHASENLSDPHVCLFGHNMASGQMFGRLGQFQQPGAAENAALYLYTPERAKELRITSVQVCGRADAVFQDDWKTESGRQTVTLATCAGYDASPGRLAVNCEVVREKLVL